MLGVIAGLYYTRVGDSVITVTFFPRVEQLSLCLHFIFFPQKLTHEIAKHMQVKNMLFHCACAYENAIL